MVARGHVPARTILRSRPYTPRPAARRPCPPDFAATYLDIGWDGIEDHYQARWPVIRRWIDECGGETLRRARARVVKLRKARGRTRGVNLGGGDDLPAQVLAEMATTDA